MLLSIQIRGGKKITYKKRTSPQQSVYSLLRRSEMYLQCCKSSSTETQMFKKREKNIRVWKIMPVKRFQRGLHWKKMGTQCSCELCQSNNPLKGAKECRAVPSPSPTMVPDPSCSPVKHSWAGSSQQAHSCVLVRATTFLSGCDGGG